MSGKQYRELICGSGKRKSFSNQIDSLYSKIQQKFLNKPAVIFAQKKKREISFDKNRDIDDTKPSFMIKLNASWKIQELDKNTILPILVLFSLCRNGWIYGVWSRGWLIPWHWCTDLFQGQNTTNLTWRLKQICWVSECVITLLWSWGGVINPLTPKSD